MAVVKTKKEAFVIGLVASLVAVIVWDIIKNQMKIFNYRKEIGDDNRG